MLSSGYFISECTCQPFCKILCKKKNEKQSRRQQGPCFHPSWPHAVFLLVWFSQGNIVIKFGKNSSPFFMPSTSPPSKWHAWWEQTFLEGTGGYLECSLWGWTGEGLDVRSLQDCVYFGHRLNCWIAFKENRYESLREKECVSVANCKVVAVLVHAGVVIVFVGSLKEQTLCK